MLKGLDAGEGVTLQHLGHTTLPIGKCRNPFG